MPLQKQSSHFWEKDGWNEVFSLGSLITFLWGGITFHPCSRRGCAAVEGLCREGLGPTLVLLLGPSRAWEKVPLWYAQYCLARPWKANNSKYQSLLNISQTCSTPTQSHPHITAAPQPILEERLQKRSVCIREHWLPLMPQDFYFLYIFNIFVALLIHGYIAPGIFPTFSLRV